MARFQRGATCTVSVDVTADKAGDFVNISGDLTSVAGNSGSATATLRVNPAPSFAKSFTPVAIGGRRHQYHCNSPSTIPEVRNPLLTCNFPIPSQGALWSPLHPMQPTVVRVVRSRPTRVAEPFLSAVASIGAGSSCTLTVDVTSAAAGDYANISGNLTSSLGDSGNATANLRVNPAPNFAKSFSPDTISAGDVSTLSFTIDNSGSTVDATALAFSDNLPAGVQIATTPNGSTTCSGGTLSAPSGGGTLSYSGGLVAAGSSCTLSVDVTADSPGQYQNISGNLTSSLGNSGSATATLHVNVPPGFAKAFSPDMIGIGETSTLTFTIDNGANVTTVGNLAFMDLLPAGLEVANPANVQNGCSGGSVFAVAGDTAINVSGASLGANSQCTISVDVTATGAGTLTNTTGDLTSDFGNSGTATAQIVVANNADLSISITDDPDPVAPGADLTYTITVANNGPADAENVSVSSILPEALTLLSTSGCNEDPSGVPDCNLGTVAANTSQDITVIAAVTSGTTGNLTFQAQVTSSTEEANPGDESATEITGTAQMADLDIDIDVIGNPHPGDTIRVRIKVKNKGPSRVNGLELFFPFPPDTYENPTWTCNATGGSDCTGSGVGDVDDVVNLKKSGKVTYWVEATLLQVLGRFTITGEIKLPVGIHDPNPADNILSMDFMSTSPADVYAMLEVVEPVVTNQPSTLKVGDLVVLQADLTNQSAFKQFNNPDSHEFSQWLPEGLGLVKAEILSGGGELIVDVGASAIHWDGPIEAGETVRIQMETRLEPESENLNTIEIQGVVHYDADGDGTNEARALSDDPNQPGAEDPTLLVLKVVPVPTLSPMGLVALIGGLFMAAFILRQRRKKAMTP